MEGTRVNPIPPCRLRRGATYFVVLMAVTLVVVIGLSGVLLARVEMRTARNQADWQAATLLAYAAVDCALAAIEANPSWRDTLQNATPVPEQALGDGTMSWMLVDQIDNDLGDNTCDPVRIHGIGRMGEATRAVSVVAFPSGETLDILRAAVHANGDLRIKDGAIVKRGPASSNQELRVDSGMLLSGAVEATSLDNQGTITGTITVPAPVKPVPPQALYKIYETMATKIAYPLSNRLENGLLGVAVNSFDNDLNASGIYKIDVPIGLTLTIRNCRIAGTLLVKLKASSKLEITDGVVWAPASPSHPALLVWADSDLGTTVTIGGRGVLSESVAGVNFNPVELPFNGEPGDSDTLDEYASVLRGVFHVMRKDLILSSGTVIDGCDRLVGCVVTEGDLELTNVPNLEADPWLLARPPLGYTTGTELVPLAGTWQWESVP